MPRRSADCDPAFDHLAPDLRRAILEILRVTRPDLLGAGPSGR